MKKCGLVTGMILLSIRFCWSQVIFEKPLSPRNANYRIEVTLDVEKKQIQGHEILMWRNISEDNVHELQFHLYMNAFKNNQSTYFRERGGRTGILGKKKAWGWIDVTSISVAGSDLTDALEFIHPDDDNEDDQTVMRIPLSESIPPGQEIQVEVDFITQLPYVFERNGYYKDFFFVAQWFPKVGVYIDSAWNCHQYHAVTEFFADYGVYEVNITIPREYIVGATGLLQNTTELGLNKIHHFRAEDVHDFAWTAWPQYRTFKETYHGIDITVLYDEDHSSSVRRYVGAVKNGLDFFSEWVGAYPYPNVTVVEPPTNCMAVGGMEYPTLITVGSYWKIPIGIKIPEMVTVHEFGHNYWYGIVGNNEFEEAWLDEGITSYSEARIMNKYYGEETSMLDFMGIRMGELAYHHSSYIRVIRKDRILRNAWTYIGGGYGACSYSKPALMLWTLENIIGRDSMDRIMRTFFQRWKFKHPHSQDFIDIVNEVAGEDYNWYFDQVLKGSNELDYQVASVWTGKERTPKGIFERNDEKVVLPGASMKQKTDKDNYRSVIKVYRKGEVIIPVDVLMVFENGDRVRQVWDGKERWIKYELVKPAKLVFAQVDPDRKLVLDSNFSNNSRTIKSRRGPVARLCTKFLFWFETTLHLFSFFG